MLRTAPPKAISGLTKVMVPFPVAIEAIISSDVASRDMLILFSSCIILRVGYVFEKPL